MITETTIIRIGNSLGSRLSKSYLEKLDLREGDRVEITVKKAKPDTKKALAALRAIARMDGALSKADIDAWQAERDADYRNREQELRDILGR
jgi:antitoxin component of MazEF toxin-antitoxin module